MSKIISSSKQFFREVRTEMRYVSWPGKADVIEGTKVVIGFSAISALFLFFVDAGFNLLVRAILGA